MLTHPSPPGRTGPIAWLRGVLEYPRPTPARRAYNAALKTAAAACEEISSAPDPRARFLALRQLVNAHNDAAAAAGNALSAKLEGGDRRGLWEIHNEASELLEMLAITERALLTGEQRNGQLMSTRGPLPPQWPDLPRSWANVLIQLCSEPNAHERARLVIKLGLAVWPEGGPTADLFHEVARAYLHLAGAADPAAAFARLHREVRSDQVAVLNGIGGR